MKQIVITQCENGFIVTLNETWLSEDLKKTYTFTNKDDMIDWLVALNINTPFLRF